MAKINRIRTFAMALIFIGIFIMYIAIFVFSDSPILMSIAMIIGFLSVISSSLVYLWIGMKSTQTLQVICPNCEKQTKILGRVDACMHCDEPLTLDPKLEGKELDARYNRKNFQQ
ncbi:YgzB family protein [Salicibibacter kimchii]|uniref:YgzB family protein n=1 Tax=Salicibibacter kimchii TaxID=2099786 RepID=UPI001D04D3F6|nr:YgzB family protein [Salicibibacter kimchii]